MPEKRKVAVGLVEVERDRGRRIRGSTADLRGVELNPIRKLDADTMLSSRRGAPYRTGRGLEHLGYHDTCCSTLDVHVKLKGSEDRRMHRRRHHPIDPPVGCALVGLAAVQYRSQSVSLLTVGLLVDDTLELAVALVNRSRPRIENRSAQAIERHIPEVALIDPNSREAAAVSVR